MAREANGLVSLPILDTSSGTELGRVKDVLFDTDAHAVYGLLIAAPAGEMFLPRSSVRGYGMDAVTVSDPGAITPVVTEPRAQELMQSGIRLRGSKVVTEIGDALGTLDKIVIEDSGEVAEYVATKGILGLGTRTQFLPAHVRTIGADAIVVSGDVANGASPADQDGAATGGDELLARTPETDTPPGTDPTKETIVTSPDSQPGNLVEDEFKERAG